ncbi:MAG: cyclic nucleotide-binding domain-containing protein [Anaerolineae bacterium]|nr:cyclic nucleotide-binding domain-containing protein [Anaerolineae bacterium]
MSMRSFFDYPTQSSGDNGEDLLFLPHWDESRWSKLLSYTASLRFRQGDTLINIGDTDSAIYIISEGQVEVLVPYKGGTQLRRTQVRESGSVIGEQAFIDNKPRSATVRAITDGAMVRLNRNAFEVFAAREPDLAREVLFDLARLLSIKLRQANQFISNWVK